MNILKKLFSLLLALTLVFSLAVPAFADDTDTFNLTINGIATGHTYKAYQIFKGRVSSVVADGDTTTAFGVDGWGDNINETKLLSDIKGEGLFQVPVKDQDGNDTDQTVNAFATASTPQDVAETLARWTDGSNHLRKFAEIVTTCIEGTPKEAKVDENDHTKYVFSGLEGGYYLIVDTATNSANTNDYYSEVMLQVSRTTSVNVKGDYPQVSKSVSLDPLVDPYSKAISVAANQSFTFLLGADLPTNYGDYEHYYYEFVDTLGANFEMDTSTLKVYLVHSNSANHVTEISATNYTVGDPTQANDYKLTIKFGDLKSLTTNQSDTVVVTYQAKLTGNYVVGGEGNPNTVVLKYSNDPANYTNGDEDETLRIGQTTPSKAQVFTYGLEIEKIDAATKRKLTGAEFVLYRHVADNNTSNTAAPEDEEQGGADSHEDEHIQYAVFDTTMRLTGWTDQPDSATPIKVANTGEKAGTVTVYGLTGTTYHLKEMVAPGGYNKLDYDPTIQIDPTLDLKTSDSDTYVVKTLNYTLNKTNDGAGDAAKGIVTIAIENNSGKLLPSTGGMGTTVLYAAGGILVLLAVVMLVTKKRMHNN